MQIHDYVHTIEMDSYKSLGAYIRPDDIKAIIEYML